MVKNKPGSAPTAHKLPNITDSFVEDAARPARHAVYYFDKARTGFGVKIYPANRNSNKPAKKVYGIRVTVEGQRKQWIKIGPHGDTWKADSAREEARLIRLNLEHGDSPFFHRKNRKAALLKFEDMAKGFFINFKDEVDRGLRSEGTYKVYKQQWNANVPAWLKTTSIAELKQSLFKRALKEISYPKGRKSRLVVGNRTLAMMSSILGWVLSLDPEDRMGLAENFCDGVKRNPETESRGVWLEDEDQAKLIAFLQDPENRRENWWEAEKRSRIAAKLAGTKRQKHFQPPYLITNQAAHALLVLFLTGLRSWEVMALQWKDFHDRTHTVRVRQTKRGADPGAVAENKRIFISDEVQAVLDQIPEDSEWVFPSIGRGTKAASGHIENLQDSWERVRSHLGLPDIRLHDFRHTAASEVGDSPGVTVQDLQAGFGWKTVQTASRYSHSKNRERDKRIQEATSNRIDRLAQVEVEAPPKKEYTYKAKGPRKPRTRERGKGRRGLALETLNLENLNAASSGEKALGKKTRKGSKSQESQGS
jgi:integrase